MASTEVGTAAGSAIREGLIKSIFRPKLVVTRRRRICERIQRPDLPENSRARETLSHTLLVASPQRGGGESQMRMAAGKPLRQNKADSSPHAVRPLHAIYVSESMTSMSDLFVTQMSVTPTSEHLARNGRWPATGSVTGHLCAG